MGFERGISFVELQGIEWSRLRRASLSVRVQFPVHPPSPPSPPFHPDPQYPFTSSSCLGLLSSLLYCLVDAVGGDAAGGEPGWSWTAARGPHRGPPGGTLRGRPPQRLARALPRPGPHAPNLRRATERCGWVGKQAAGGNR